MVEIVGLLKKDVIGHMIKSGKRPDGRGFDQYRQIYLQKGVLNAGPDGSALVRMGKTQVLAAVKFTIGAPFPDRPKEGVLITSAEFLPTASSEFELGPPGEDAIELARVVDKGIRASEIIDMKSFYVEEGKVLTMFVDIYILDHDGNLIDASALAAMAAILDAKLPKIENGEIIWGEYDKPLEVKGVVTTSTFYKIGNKILLDACKSEEEAADARLSVSFLGDKICAMQKGMNGGFKASEIDFIVKTAYRESKRLKNIVLKTENS